MIEAMTLLEIMQRWQREELIVARLRLRPRRDSLTFGALHLVGGV